MRNSIRLAILSFAIFITLSRCVEPFDLPVSAKDSELLVVEGHVNVDYGTGNVVLTRTQDLADAGAPRRETMAQVFIETDQNEKVAMYETQAGNYRITGLQLDYGRMYRLLIITAKGEQYSSDFVSTEKTPEIDSVTWRVEPQGVQISVNTHDPANNTRYYKWDFEETYEYTAYYNSLWDYRYGEVIFRPQEEQIYRCWQTKPSQAIYVGTTVQLAQDVVRDFPLIMHDKYSEKLGLKYSILVRQYGISRAEFDYWQLLKKNTENVGSIFDAQPSQVRGNIRNINNPEKDALGLFSARSVSTKRMFITGKEMANKGILYRKMPECPTEDVGMSLLPVRLQNNWLIVEEKVPLSSYMISSRNCADCRTKGGTTTKPAFWN